MLLGEAMIMSHDLFYISNIAIADVRVASYKFINVIASQTQ